MEDEPIEFHKTFLDILQKRDPLEGMDFNYLKIRSELLQDIIDTAPYYLQGINREQILIDTHKDYYIARDIMTNSVYMCFRNLLMLDFDNVDGIVELLTSDKTHSWKIYKTTRGFHAFCVSHEYEYRKRETVELMLKYKDIDIDYIRFCYLRGYCVRLNKKFYQDMNTGNYIYIATTNSENVIQKLDLLTDLHIEKCKEYTSDLNINGCELFGAIKQ